MNKYICNSIVACLVIARRNFSFDAAISYKLTKIVRDLLCFRLPRRGYAPPRNDGENRAAQQCKLFPTITTKKLSLLTIIFLISANQSLASPSTTTFQVTANIANACNVTATNLAFGSYISSTNSDVNSTITVTCTNGTTYKIGLDKGVNGASTSTRQMKGLTPTNLLNYSLYSDNARSVNWGLPPTDSVAGTGTGLAQNYTVYGRIPSGQNTAAVDSYSDTIGVSVTFP